MKGVLALLWLPCALGHVGLTYPPARKYQLDFLDTFRTVTPCGMAKKGVVTLVKAGETLKVTWHLGYPHRGGFQLELLDKYGKKVTDLTPKDTFEGTGDRATQEYDVSIAQDMTCKGCTIRLLRQALEWGSKYRFQSCSDVDIVAAADYRNTCSGNGSPSGSSCACKKTYHGDQCQYKDDCVDDGDCNNNGKCQGSGGTALPLKECYCQAGYFGQFCAKKSDLKAKSVNESDYEVVLLRGDDFKFLWKYLDGNKKEVEGVVVAKTTNYVAIGWRPEDITKSCHKFPADATAPNSRDFVNMDCQDMVIAKVKGDLSNIGDYYTRDRSTPRRDSFYGGKDDLTAAVGWEENGVTTFKFRRAAAGTKDSGKADHDFTGALRLVWAFGQSGQAFYKEDELKYHGGNRGYMRLGDAGNEGFTEQRILLVVALVLLGLVVVVQLVQKIVKDCFTSPKPEEHHPMMGMK